MVRLFFGLPGCGKTTLMVHRIRKFHKKFPEMNIYCNVPVTLDYVTYIDNNDVGMFNLHDGTIFLDEASLFADSRDYKHFSRDKMRYFLLHRHYNVNIELYTQQWDAIDKKIRVITDRVYYVYKPLITGLFMTKYYRIPYGIIIPDPNKKDGEKLGEIVQGYCKPNVIQRLFCPRLFRPTEYKYFDSWECPKLPDLPKKE